MQCFHANQAEPGLFQWKKIIFVMCLQKTVFADSKAYSIISVAFARCDFGASMESSLQQASFIIRRTSWGVSRATGSGMVFGTERSDGSIWEGCPPGVPRPFGWGVTFWGEGACIAAPPQRKPSPGAHIQLEARLLWGGLTSGSEL